MKYVNKQGRFGGNACKPTLDFTLLFWRAFPSHGRGRRFNPCSAHQPSLLRSYGWQAIRCARLRSSEGCPAKPAGRSRARRQMKYVYLLQSIDFPDETYVGLTDDLRPRFTAHNAGRSPHTSKYKPWRLVTYIAFSNEQKAVEFERYLKSASGRAFANKRLR
jgi:putative endonuclease